MTRAPLAPLALAFAAGIGLAPWASPEAAWTVWGIGLVWGLSLTALGRLTAAAVFVMAGVAAGGALRAAAVPLADDHVARLPLPATARVEGRLAAEPVRLAPDRTRLLLDTERVDGRTRSGRLQATVQGPPPPLDPGQRLQVELRLVRARGFRNPGVFDHAAWLRRQGILVVGSGPAAGVTALEAGRPGWPVRVRRAVRGAIERALPPASAALLDGLLLGERADLPPEIDEAFRRAGVYHVLAVSGFNVALVAGSVLALLRLARLGRRPAAAGALAAVLGFAVVVGPEPSVLRAVVMGVLVLGALLLDREASVVNGLALAALVLLAARPADLADPGFQLSFAATLGIVLAPLPRGRLAAALAVSAAAQLAVLPIALAHFNQLPVLGVLANLGAVPLAGLATVLGLLGAALSLGSEAAGALLFNAAWPVLLALRALVALVARVPGALLHLPAPPWSATAAYVLSLALGLAAWRRWRRAPARGQARRPPDRRPVLLAGAAALLLLTAVAVGAWPLVRPPDGRLRLTVLDGGQGDAIVVETPDGRALLVDGGPGGPWRLDAGDRVVSPFLWNRGVLRLAAVVATHDDQDHAGGLAAVRRNFAVAGTLAPGHRHWLGGVPMLVLAPGALPAPGDAPPAPGAAAPARRGNDRAPVVRVDHGLVSFLLASDIGADAEAALLAGGAPVAATVLKVAHHGAAGSTTRAFLGQARPRVAVISVGARNPYGHPSARTLERLAAAGARVYRTDRDGAVILETDGAGLTVTAWATGAVERYCFDPERGCPAEPGAGTDGRPGAGPLIPAKLGVDALPAGRRRTARRRQWPESTSTT